MEAKTSLWSMKQFKPQKGKPNIKRKARAKVPTDWEQELDRLETVFRNLTIPLQPFQLNKWTKINDLRFCIEADIAVARANIGKRTFLPSLERLQQIELTLVPDKQREIRKTELNVKRNQRRKKRGKINATYQII